jgi:succinate-semialdehyde dehydrogenase/glutarate-semialdehyde dehydrogenase
VSDATAPALARRATESARLAAEAWSRKTVRERARRLLDFRDLLIDRADEIVAVVCGETGKPRFDVLGELFHVAGLIGWLARKGPGLLKDRPVRPSLLWNKSAAIFAVPWGVVGVIAPWNYPIALSLVPTLQALLAGNGVVLKPSQRTPSTNALLQDLFRQWSPESSIVALLEGGPESALSLVQSGVDKVFFTGGVLGGRAIAKAAAERLVPVVLELGGSDPMLVCADADLQRAAHAAAWGAFLNAGQSCASVERCYVDKSVAAEFLDQLKRQSQSLRLASDPLRGDEDFDVGRLVDRAAFERIRELCADAVETGARVLAGGDGDADRLIWRPTILLDVPPTARLLQEEIFGPLLAVQIVEDVGEAVRLANQTEYGLSASVWTKDRRRGRAIAERLCVGGVVVNDCMIHFGVAELPFGGVKSSGYGRTQGAQGLYEFCVFKTLTAHRFGPRRQFNWFPYAGKHRMLRRFLRLLFRRGVRRRFLGP